MGDGPDLPTRRAVTWFAAGWSVRDQVFRRLADRTGLDGFAAGAAIAHAVADDRSPWAPLVDELFVDAYRDLVLAPIGVFVRAMADAFAPAVRAIGAAFGALTASSAESLEAAGIDPAELDPPLAPCHCLCGLHKQAPGVCLGEVHPRDIVNYRPPRTSTKMQQHTIRMCRPCAAAQSGRGSRPAVTG